VNNIVSFVGGFGAAVALFFFVGGELPDDLFKVTEGDRMARALAADGWHRGSWNTRSDGERSLSMFYAEGSIVHVRTLAEDGSFEDTRATVECLDDIRNSVLESGLNRVTYSDLAPSTNGRYIIELICQDDT
jgi:hypothetical protein